MLKYIVYKNVELDRLLVEEYETVSFDALEQLLEFKSQEILLISTSPELVKRARTCKIAAIACQRKDMPAAGWEGERLVIELDEGELELDAQFVRRQYLREHKLPWTILTTQRCMLRELTLEDLPDLYELYAQPHMTDYVEPLYEWSEEVEYQRAYISNMYEFYEFGMWLVFDKKTSKLIGRAGLELREYPTLQEGTMHEETDYGYELGYMIAPSVQGQGIATEVCLAILQYAKDVLQIDQVNCLIEPQNAASIRLVDRLGFRCLGKMHMDRKEFVRYILTLDSCNL